MPMHLFLIYLIFTKFQFLSAWAKSFEHLRIPRFQTFSDSKRVREKLHNELTVFCLSPKSTFFNRALIWASSRLRNTQKVAQKSDFIVQLLQIYLSRRLGRLHQYLIFISKIRYGGNDPKSWRGVKFLSKLDLKINVFFSDLKKKTVSFCAQYPRGIGSFRWFSRIAVSFSHCRW